MTTNGSGAAGGSGSGGGSGGGGSSSQSLLVVVLDVSPMGWGDRDLKRTAQDKARAAQGKRSVGPAVLEEVMDSVQAFCSAFGCVERDSGIVIIGVADNQVAVVYPRKFALNEWLTNPENYIPDFTSMRQDLCQGIAELIGKASMIAQIPANSNPSSRQGAMASGFSSALCLINRFLVTARAGGVSALQDYTEGRLAEDNESSGGIVALMGNKDHKKSKSGGGGTKQLRAWSPRIMLVQASEDRSRDYNAFMNCAFAALKQQVVVDGCFLTAGGPNSPSSSVFLEQVCDLTNGVFLAPSGAAQVDGALTEVMYSVFLPPLACRASLNLPTLNKVDFRARCFESGEIVDMAFVCNQCLSIFQNKPKQPTCPTCNATVIDVGKKQQPKG